MDTTTETTTLERTISIAASPETVLADVDRTVVELTGEALHHPGGPLTGACERAAAFLRGWWGEPPAPPFADGD